MLRCPEKLEHGDTLIVWKLDRVIDKGEARQYVADLLNVGPATLYRALG